MRRFLPLCLFALVAIAFAFALTRDPRRLDSVIIDQPFPAFELTRLGAPDVLITQEDLKGSVNLVNIFGSWCVACNVEHPVLMQIAQSQTINMIGVNWRDEADAAKDWLTTHGNPYDTIIYDPESVLIIPLGVVGAPETFITDKKGHVRYKHIGPISQEDWRKTLRPIILKLETET